ncbi:MAG: InlB B-repeat-containing protein, partial [Clostridiales bacterium]|nr:InlB B-repeat-containing protein [Clostridiales bacterium]
MKRKELKFLVPVFFVMVVLLVVNAYIGSREQTQAELRAIAESPGINMEDLVLNEEEAEALGLSPAQASNPCEVYAAQSEAGIFSADTFVVSYLTDGGKPEPDAVVVEAGTLLTRPADPVKKGYTFLHWEYRLACDNKTYVWNFDTDVVGFNVTLVAIYKQEGSSDIFYNVNFDTKGGRPVPSSQIVKEGDKVEEPEAPVKDGYIFDGWFNGNDEWDFDTDVVTGDLNLVAKWTEDNGSGNEEHDVTFDTDGGTPVPPAQKIKDGEKVTKPQNPTKPGYIFDGWFNGNDEWDFDTDVVTGDLNLVAKWTEDNGGGNDEEHDVTFDTDGGTPVPPPQKIKDGDKITKPQDPSKPGYIFDGWFDGEDEWDFDKDVVTGDLDLVAEWEIDPNYRFTVKFNADGGSPVPADQKIGTEQKVTEPNPAPTKAGYNFDGWYLGNKEWDFDTDVVTSDITLVAKWEVDSREEHEVTFDTDGGTPVPPPQNIKDGGKVTKPQDPSKPGYIFDGWFDGEDEWDFDNDVVNGDLDLVAEWEIDPNYRFTVKFDADGGSPVPAEQKIGTEQKVNKPYPDPTKPGYIFDGWFDGNDEWDFNTDVVTKDLTLKAKWVTDPNYKDEYTVKFNPNGGTPTPANQIVARGGKVTKPADPTRAGYRFI